LGGLNVRGRPGAAGRASFGEDFMQVDLTSRPRLADLNRLAGPAEAEARRIEAVFESALEAKKKKQRVTSAATLKERSGYSADFLDGLPVPLPRPVGSSRRDVLPVEGSDGDRLDYQHFSVVMSKARRMAMFVAVNIDGKRSRKIQRDADIWNLDGRIPTEAQIGEELYFDNDLDRGHLVRREDPNWGSQDQAETANEDTFHFTNCAPQMAAFNQRTWLGLESYVLDEARASKDQISVFTGPVFGGRDPEYRGVRIPLAYWKVIAFINEEGRPSATAYMIDQKRELKNLEATFGVYKTYQRSIRQIEELADLDFGELSNFDGFSNEERATNTRVEAVLRSLADMRV
jgi:endonuclease G